MPTVLQMVGIEVPKEVQGASVLELMKPGPEGQEAEKAWGDRGAYSQADYGHLSFAWSAEQSLRAGKYLYIQAPRRELYDEEVDAKAAQNLSSTSPAVADTLSARLEDFWQKTTNTQEMPRTSLDSVKLRKLSALGYVATGTNSALSTSPERGADPKDKIGVANSILRATEILQDWRCEKAMPVLHDAIATDPNIAILHFYLGGCYMEGKDYEEAALELRKALKLDPTLTAAEMNLGRALIEIKDYEGAVTAFEHVEKLEPHILEAHIYLVIAYAKTNRVQDEIRECRRVLQSEPDHFGSNLNLGRFLAQSGDLDGALPSLQKAESLRPNAPRPHIYLADVYTKLGREEDAKREQGEVERLGAVPADQQPDGVGAGVPESQ